DSELGLCMLFFLQFLISFEDGFYFVQQDFAIKRFGDVVVGAQFIPVQDIFFHAFSDRKNNGTSGSTFLISSARVKPSMLGIITSNKQMSNFSLRKAASPSMPSLASSTMKSLSSK